MTKEGGETGHRSHRRHRHGARRDPFLCGGNGGDSPYRVLENLREPIRLGGDVFLKGTIREENIRKAEAASFRHDILGQEKECALEIAFRAFREKSFGKFLEMAGTAGGRSRVFGAALRS